MSTAATLTLLVVAAAAVLAFTAWLLLGHEPDPDDQPAYDEAAADPLNAGISGMLGFPNVVRWRHRRPRP